MNNVLSIILGGGKGTRLFPLTQDRSKPAVPFGAKYRLVDIPISNCINSGMKKIYILTQFNTASLHLHIGSTYNFDAFTSGFVEILAAEQTPHNTDWYLGTADAVRKNFYHFRTQNPSHYIILSGDQLYRMDLKKFMKEHIESGAEVSIASTAVDRRTSDQLGILKLDKKGMIETFLEKPGPDKDIQEYKIPENISKQEQLEEGKDFLASMGIYIFNADIMEKALENDLTDFGKEIIPDCIGKLKVRAHIYQGYWEDIGTIRNYYEANLNLGTPVPRFNLYIPKQKIYTHRRDLPAPKIGGYEIRDTLIGDGSIIMNSRLVHSIIGVRSVTYPNVTLDGVYILGADFYETIEDKLENHNLGRPHLGIGEDTHIRGAIIDKNVRIGQGCRIGLDDSRRQDGDYGTHMVVDGIIVIPKNTVIPPGTVF